jgi:tol-pal system protein YbgF
MQSTLMFFAVLLTISIFGCMPQKGPAETQEVSSIDQIQDVKREANLLRSVTDQLNDYDTQLDRLKQANDETRRKLAHAVGTAEECRTEIQQLHGVIEELQQRIHQDTNPHTAPTPVTIVPPETRSTRETVPPLYGQAMQAYQQTDYQTAIALLTSFLSQHPPASLAAQAQYWIGESLYAQHRYEAAIVAFDDVVQQYPTHPKAPTALLKQAYAFAELQDQTHAEFFLQQVQKKYPRSSEASQAAARLEQLKR